MQPGPVKFQRTLIVADIKDEVLLGDDILRLDPEGPADILNSEKVLLFRGECIPMVTVKNHSGAQRNIWVLAASDFDIPGMTECLIDGYLERDMEDPVAEKCLAMEPNPEFQEKYGLVVAPIIIDTAGKVTSKVCVFNPFRELQRVKADSLMVVAEPVIMRRVLVREENPFDRHNYAATR